MKNMIILGIDPGIADTGFGVIKKQGDSYGAVEYGTIKTSKTQELPDRLESLYDGITRVIKKHNPEKIAVEKIYFAKNAKTAIIVAHARGAILLASKKSGQKGAETTEFTPLQVKQALTGYGNADKRQMQEMTKIILKLKKIPKPDDAADALAIAICAGQTKHYGK